MSTIETTNCPSWMDKKCLELWLSTYYGAITVTDLNLAAASAKGDNHLSDMIRLSVKTKEGQSYSLIVKNCLEEGVVANAMRESAIFKKEQEMYGNTLPKMQELLQKTITGTFESFAPVGIYTSRNFLILEDLTQSGFKMMDRRQGLDLKQCLLVMRTLAKFHAASVFLNQQSPCYMKQYQVGFYDDPAVVNSWQHFFSGLATTLAEELDTWTEEWKTYANKLRKLSPVLFKKVRKVISRDDSPFNVLCHGDLWTNNMMFRGHAEAVRFIDFQLTHFTSPAIDLHYFIYTSPNLDTKLNHIDTMIQEYQRELSATLTALNYTGKILTLDEMRAEFKRTSLFGLHSLIAPATFMQCDPACGFTFEDVLSTGVNPGPKMYGEDYKKAVRHHLPLFDSIGAFDYE